MAIAGTARGGESKATEARPLFPQTRAIEIRLPADFRGVDAPRLVWQVQSAGFNAILLNCFWGGSTLHPSPTMRQYGFPGQHRRYRGTDPVEALLAAARREGVTVYALLDGLYVGNGKARRNPVLRRRPDWAVRGRNGANGTATGFLCPVNRAVRRFLGDLAYEIVERYSFRGLYLRYVHLPIETPERRADYCRCEYCRSAVWHALGVVIDEIPDDPDHPDRYNLDSWRTKQLAGLVRYVRLRVTGAWDGAMFLFEAYLGEKDAPPNCCGLQNPCVWAVDQLLPVVTFRPLSGTPQCSESWIARVGALAQCAVTMPVLSALPDGALVETVERFAREPVAGVVVCEPHDLTALPLNRLAVGPFREPAAVAEDRPLVSVRSLLARTLDVLSPDEALRAFLSDVLRAVEPMEEFWTPAQRQSLSENLLGLEERIANRKITLGEAEPIVLRNFRLARRLLQLAQLES